MMLRYRIPSKCVSVSSPTLPGEQWNPQTKSWALVSVPRDLQCVHCEQMIVEEDKSIFYQHGDKHSHAWCQMSHNVDVSKMHDEDGDYSYGVELSQRFVNEVSRTLMMHEMAFPTMRVYQYFLTRFMHDELCDDHDDNYVCCAENCSANLTRHLKAEKECMTDYMKIAWKCGHLNTVDGLLDIYSSILDYFRPGQKFCLLDILDKKRTLQQHWAAKMACTMGEIVAGIQRAHGTKLAQNWLRSSVHLRSESVRERVAYCKVVDTYYKLGVLELEKPAMVALHEAKIGSSISPMKNRVI